MRIIKIKEDKFDEVIDFLNKNFSSPTHWPEWNLLVSKYYNTVFYYFVLIDKNEIMGICPIHETITGLKKNLNSGQFHYIPNGGWLLNKEKEINIFNIPIPFNARFECFALPEIKEFGATYHKNKHSFLTLLINLAQSEEDIWMKSISSRRRRMIRKAQNNEIIVQKDISSLNIFYSIYESANKEYRLKNLPFAFLKGLIDVGEIGFMPFIAYYKNIPCGALGLIYDKDYAIYWIGAAVHDSKNLGQGDLLQWEAILHSKNIGCKYYDLCYIEKERLPNIYEFKKGFSNYEVKVPFIVKKRILFRIMNKLKI